MSFVIDKENPDRKQSEEEVRTKLQQVLDMYNTGVWLHLLPDIYLGYFGLKFPQEYTDCVFQWTDIVDAQTL